jgi:dephospho-CoA kinase
MIVVGAVGLNGSGKDDLVGYLKERCSMRTLSAGDVVRDIARRKDVAPTRENLHEISKEYIAKYGKDFFMSSLIAKIERNNWKAVAITGIRTPADVATLREHFGSGFYLVNLEVGDPALRFKRTSKRGEVRDSQTYEGFLDDDRAEEEAFQLSETAKKADIVIRNDSSLEVFHRRIEETIIMGLLTGKVPCR